MYFRVYGLPLICRSLHVHNRRLVSPHPTILNIESVRFAATDRSKVVKTLHLLRDDLQKEVDEEKRLKLVSVKQDHTAVKLSLKDKIIHELKHYYHGFRLLALETRVSSKYAVKVLRGATLNRRERQQLVRTVSDLFRLVPFSIFVIVPFMELALPLFIKLFPNMLPSTFQETSKEEEKVRKQLKVRVEMAKFLQDTIEELALERKAKNNAKADSKALEFAHFIKRVRAEGGYVSNQDIFKFSKLFEDELTLDNLSMGQLRSLCRLMSLQTLGSPEILRFQLKMKLRELKADDKQIAAEGGVDALSSLDLQQACRARGMRAIGLSEDRLKEQLKQWLELSLNDKVPPSFLLLSRTLYLPEDISFADRLKTLVQNLPEGVAEQTRQKLTELEGGKVDHKARLQLVKQIEEAIAKETEIEEEQIKKDEQQKQLQKEAMPKAEVMEMESDFTVDSNITYAEKLRAGATETDRQVDPVDLSSLGQALVGGPILEAKNDIDDLKEKLMEHTEDLMEVNALDVSFSETKVARRLRSKLTNMIENVDSIVSQLEERKRDVTETIADPAEADSHKRKTEQLVRIGDLIEALEGLKNNDEDRKMRMKELLKRLDDDKDGFIDGKLVLEVIDLLENHKNIPVSAEQMASLLEVLRKEGQVEAAAVKAMEEAQFSEPIAPHASNIDDVSKQVSCSTPPIPLPDVDPKLTVPLKAQQAEESQKSV